MAPRITAISAADTGGLNLALTVFKGNPCHLSRFE
jgi:hypothetical protein